MRDLVSHIDPKEMISPDVYTADNTPVAVDLQGRGACMICIRVGAGGITFDDTNKIEFVLTKSDDGVTYTPVVQADVDCATVTGGGIVKAFTEAHAAPALYKIGVKCDVRYLKLLADFSGTHGTGTHITAFAITGRPDVGPVTDCSL